MKYFIVLLTILIILRAIQVKKRNKKKKQELNNLLAQQKQTLAWGYALKSAIEPELLCQEAMELRDKPIPVESLADLPTLPLPGCTQKMCRCHYEPMRERRINSERRTDNEQRLVIRFEDKPDRRSRLNRRKNNRTWNNDF
jgi:hypothetical protein